MSKIMKFLTDVKTEMAKVQWPSKDELISSTYVVIIVSMIFAVFIFAVDRLLSQILQVVF